MALLRPPWPGLAACLLVATSACPAAEPADTPPAPLASTPMTPPAPEATAEAADTPERVPVTVSGLGWLMNLQMKAMLRQAQPKGPGPSTHGADTIEDGAFLLLHHARNLGYLDATVAAEIHQADGQVLQASWPSSIHADPLPRLLSAQRVDYRVEVGVRYFYETLTFRGLTALDDETARRYFIRTDALLATRALRRFSEGEFSRALDALRTTLLNQGYATAKVTAEPLQFDRVTGAVGATVLVEQGPVHRIRQIHIRIRESAEGPVLEEETRQPGGWLLSRTTREDLEQELLARWYHEGYPDASARIDSSDPAPNPAGDIEVDLQAEVVRGQRIRLGTIRFTGPGADAIDPAKQQARLEGPWLDRLAIDEARARIARQGGIRFIEVRYEDSPDVPGARDPVFDLEPARKLSVDALAGFRSYELLYGGLDVTRRGLFNLGHSVNLRAVQSFKATEATATYSIPDAFLDNLTVFAQLDLLLREELSFRREEYRSGAGVRRVFEETGHQAGLRYNYELLKALEAPSILPGRTISEDQQRVSSIVLDWWYDRRDSAVTPRRGFDAGVSLEVAAPQLGGDARYLRPEVRASGHFPLRHGRFLHTSVRYSLITDPGNEGLMPFNKRFFPGGDDSVRGYLRGEAAPLNGAGELIGAESALVWNLELEQLLTPSWSVVAFVDGVAETANLDDALVDDVLWSVGLGLRWNTVIGPVRLEYGYNLNPRDHDPVGTVQFSIGFPF